MDILSEISYSSIVKYFLNEDIMKKLLAILLSISIVATLLFSIPASVVKATASSNLIINSSFESGLTGWTTQSTVTIENAYVPNIGNCSCHAFNRVETWASPMQYITDAVQTWGYGSYVISVYVKIDGSLASDRMSLVINRRFMGTQNWVTASGVINNSNFTKIEGTVSITSAEELGSLLIYLTSSSGTNYNFYCDDFSLQKANGIKETIPPPTPRPLDTVLDRPENTLVGAIRWDAWLNPTLPTFNAPGTSAADYIGAQMVRSLSPTQYHFRLPFFGTVESASKVNLPDYTQQIFDQEMLYAKNAGIDYFMYCWYADGSGMDTARKLHTTSQYRNDVKMTAMWDITSISSYSYYTDFLKQSYWQNVADGRPMVYVSNGGAQTVYGINKFRDACMAAGLKNPYLIGIGTFGSTPSLVQSQGLDAYTHYALGGGVSGGKPYSELMTLTKNTWQSDVDTGVQYLPVIPSGWDRRPRIDNPVSWEGPTADKTTYFQTASAAEIAALLQNAIDFNKAHKDKTNINSVLFYAWNEHDEGGWICPTVTVDANGLAIQNAYGSNLVNDSRLAAIKPVIQANSTNVFFTVGSVTGYRGENITADIDISANSNIAAATFVLNFDSTKLEFVSASAGSALDIGMTDINPSGSKITMAYINTQGLKQSGTILEVQFKIKSDLTDQISPLTFSVPESIDLSEHNLPTAIAPGAITILDYMLGDVNKNGTITSADALMALQIASGRTAATEYTGMAADVNNNATVTSADALQILQFASGKITSFS